MSRQNMNQPMQNGIPPQWQKREKYNQAINNGLGSSQSSRDSSPRPGGIPLSQLPPGGAGMSANGPTSSANVTPHSSPRLPPFSSTPINNINTTDSSDSVQVKPQNLVQLQNIQHASSTCSLPQMHVKQNLNQPQNIQRPVSTGPQILPPPQHFEPIQNQNFSQSQSQLQNVVNPQQQKQQPLFPQPQDSASNTTNFSQSQTNSVPPVVQQLQQPRIPQQPISQFTQKTNFPVPNISSEQQHSRIPQQPINNQFIPPVNTNFPPVPQSHPVPNISSDQQQSRILQQPPSNQFIPPVNANFPQPPPISNISNQQQSRIPQQPLNNQFIPPVNANFPQSPPVANISTPVSNLHAKRYPQPLQNQNYPAPNPQQNADAYNNQQQFSQQQPPYYQLQQQQQQQQQQQMNQQHQQQHQQMNQQRNYQNMTQQMQNMNVVKSGFNKLWGNDNYDLLQCPNVLPEEQIKPPKVSLGQEFLDSANCSTEIFRCTMTKIPDSNSLLQKSRLPLGVLIHPFKDLNHLPVISCNTIVRCRACRTYINPFIFFVDVKRWKCNLCYRVNELPEEFQYDPVSKTYGDPSRRPEIKSSTIEYIAPSEYMLRPPQPAVYLYLLDISRLAIESGYLHTVCEVLSSQLSTIPGDARTQIGFLAYNSTLHFFSLAEGLSQPHEMIISDIDDIFLPCPDNLLVNLKEHTDLVSDLLTQLPNRYVNSFDNGSALGAALQAAYKLMGATGGRVTVFQTALPTLGPGTLTVREDPNQRAGKEAPHLNPATDFYKRLALDCSGHQIAVDLFLLNSQYIDIATLSGISRFSGGCMFHFPLYKASNFHQSESLERCFRRYMSRKIGFEAVMRIRCTRGLAIHTFHGNFFVRSTDLLSLPNINPDVGYGMQLSIEESLSDLQSVCFQAALLYTSSKGERRIRVHTLCLPVVSTLSEVLNSADQQCIVGLLAKMAVDRSLQSSLSDARDAFINVAIDILSSYKMSLNMGNTNNGLVAPQSLKLLPLYILALLKCTAFRTGQCTRLDDRVFAMCDMKTLPLPHLVQAVYPDLYPVYRLGECPAQDEDGTSVPKPRRLQLTARNIDSHGAYLLDIGQQMILFVCQNVSQQFLVHALGVPNYNSIPDQSFELKKFESPDNERLHAFINSLNDEKPYPASLIIMRENSPNRNLMLERLIEDRIEFALSYNEFLQHLKTQVK